MRYSVFLLLIIFSILHRRFFQMPYRNVTMRICILMLIQNDLTDCIRFNIPAPWILHAVDLSADCRLYVAVFKLKIGTLHLAVLQNKSFRIAKRLRSDDFAADKTQIFGIPRKVFSFYNAVVYRNVFTVPKRILRV